MNKPEKRLALTAATVLTMGVLGFAATRGLTKKQPIAPAPKSTPDITAVIPKPSQVCDILPSISGYVMVNPNYDITSPSVVASLLGHGITAKQVSEGLREPITCLQSITVKDLESYDSATKVGVNGLSQEGMGQYCLVTGEVIDSAAYASLPQPLPATTPFNVLTAWCPVLSLPLPPTQSV